MHSFTKSFNPLLTQPTKNANIAAYIYSSSLILLFVPFCTATKVFNFLWQYKNQPWSLVKFFLIHCTQNFIILSHFLIQNSLMEIILRKSFSYGLMRLLSTDALLVVEYLPLSDLSANIENHSTDQWMYIVQVFSTPLDKINSEMLLLWERPAPKISCTVFGNAGVSQCITNVSFYQHTMVLLVPTHYIGN